MAREAETFRVVATMPFNAAERPHGIAVNTATHHVWIGSDGDGTLPGGLLVLNGAGAAGQSFLLRIPLGGTLADVAVNATTGRVYTLDQEHGTITMLEDQP